jgi:hypothetical protein
MPETFEEKINRVLRDHEGYDGNGGTGALPIGDRSTARKPISKRDLREALRSFADVEGNVGDALTARDQAIEAAQSADADAAQSAEDRAYMESRAAALEGLAVSGVVRKETVDCATTTGVTLSGEQTIDGVATNASRVLVKNQGSSANNGIYVTAAGAWSRASDMNTVGEVQGAAVYVGGGNSNVGRTYYTGSEVTALGTDPIVWVLSEDQAALNEAVSELYTDGIVRPAPNSVRTRNGVKSPGNDFLTKAIVSARVIGARPGYLYGIRYFKNGSTALLGPRDGWIIEEQPVDNYGGTSTANRVLTYTHDAPNISRSTGTKQAVRLVSPSRTNLAFEFLIHIASLPPFGTPVDMLNAGDEGYSWVIDPSQYEYEAPVKTIAYNVTAAGEVAMQWQSDDRRYRLTFGPHGYNDLPNVVALESATQTGEFVSLFSGTTDWLPPLAFTADANGDGGPLIYTGGNHGSTGSAGGDTTAENILYDMEVDGTHLPFTDSAGSCERVSFRIVNELQASNTLTENRKALRQYFSLTVTAAGIEVTALHEALEDITLRTDNGLQCSSVGFTSGEQMFLGGQYPGGWRAYDVGEDSGDKSAYSDAWAVLLRNADDQMVMWLDRNFEAGDGRYVAATSPMLRGHGTSDKFYNAVVAQQSPSFAAGERYAWRGGYSLGGRDVYSAARFYSIFDHIRDGRKKTVFVKDAQNWVDM